MRKILFLAVIFLHSSCSKPFEIDLAGTSEVLVFEGSVKNGVHQQEVILSTLEGTDQVAIEGASVSVHEYEEQELLNSYTFQHTEGGIYRLAFEGRIGMNYQVDIQLPNGEEYQSSLEKLLGVSEISRLEALEASRDDGEEVIAVQVSSAIATTKSSRRYLYSFTETFVISPPWTSFYFWDGTAPIGRPVPLDPICWQTNESKTIVLKSTQELANDKVENLLINQLLPYDLKLRSKYSIEVSQSSISELAYNYFDALLKSIEDPSALTNTQPGNPVGNIVSNTGKTAIGYFMAVDTKTQRIFIEPSDFDLIGNIPFNRLCEPTILLDMQELSLFMNTASNSTEFLIHTGPESGWWVFPRECIDCSHLGTTERPDYWE